MRQTAKYYISDICSFKKKLCYWASQFQKSVILQGPTDNIYGRHLKYDMLAAVDSISEIYSDEDSFEKLYNFHKEKSDWLFGFLSYDLKNEIEDLKSDNADFLTFPNLHFFQPKWVFTIINDEINIHFPENIERNEIQLLFNKIMQYQLRIAPFKTIRLENRISKQQYVEGFEQLLEHIKRGDIYEVNYCQEFFAQNVELDPILIYHKLHQISNSPFAAYYRCNGKYLMCSSPERFLKKEGAKLISQPIKGTRKRSVNKEEDNRLREELFNCTKEQSENVMIVDLVRNDLSRTASPSSVKVEELFGVYSFPQVHQMISTVVSELGDSYNWSEAIRDAFPMGSMTGAPKISAMKLIEKIETFKRGLYSGAIGYITPLADFDFNVVIRSIIYNSNNKYVSMAVGSAITINANANDEYEECLLKAKAMLEVLND